MRGFLDQVMPIGNVWGDDRQREVIEFCQTLAQRSHLIHMEEVSQTREKRSLPIPTRPWPVLWTMSLSFEPMNDWPSRENSWFGSTVCLEFHS